MKLTAETVAALDAAREAVWKADAAWMAELDSAERKAEYEAAKNAFRELEAPLLAAYAFETRDCHRCGGAGGWAGWPGFTCYECMGHRKRDYELKKYKFDATPDVRARREAKRRAEREAEDVAYQENLKKLPAEVAEALEAGRLKLEAWYGSTREYDESQRPDRETSFRGSLAEKLKKYGKLSEKQVAAVERGLERDKERAAEAAALAEAGPLEEGTRELEGEVLSTKSQQSHYGTQFKMLVKLTDGNKVWGTVPRALEEMTYVTRWHDADGMYQEEPAKLVELKGARVRFTAKVERSRDDDHFGFFSRPRKVELREEE